MLGILSPEGQMELELTGVQELVAKLEKARVQMTGPEMKKALRAGGRVIKAAMVERAPVLDAKTANSTSLEPGALREGIRVYAPPNDDPADVLIGPAARVAHVARWGEYGHRQVSGGYLKLLGNGSTRGTGEAGEDVPAHPFLRPAFEASVAEAGEAIAASLAESYREVLG
jgi:HK97 gp10 family phage protein